jgi:hypothetical protein
MLSYTCGSVNLSVDEGRLFFPTSTIKGSPIIFKCGRMYWFETPEDGEKKKLILWIGGDAQADPGRGRGRGIVLIVNVGELSSLAWYQKGQA